MKSRLTLLALGAPALLIVAGLDYENAAGWMAQRRHPAPGRLVDVGGHRLHVRCEGTGEPTVVLEAGAANGSLSWYKVVPEIAKLTRVCAYDRAGHGWSDSGPRPRLPSVVAGELHALLSGGGLPPPYVMVGHSLGGLYARTFATRYPAEVAAVVLVDSSHTDQNGRIPAALQGTQGQRKLQHRMMGASVGVPRLFGWEFCGGGPAAIRDELYATECGGRFYRTLKDEMGGDVGTPEWNEVVREVAGLGSLGAMPLTVVTADPDRPIPGVAAEVEPELRKALRVDMQQELARLSSNSRLVIAKDSGHMVPFDRPDVIADAVRALVAP
jgi:pimeloyl-ACP methyl ester carboxylesterase